jgi:WD40 repeat protein
MRTVSVPPRFLLVTVLSSVLSIVLGACATTPPGPPASIDDALAKAGAGAYLTGTFAGLLDPTIVNRRDFIYALAFSEGASELAFVHHVSTNMELTATGLAPLAPKFQSPVNSSEFDIEDVVFLAEGAGAGMIAVPSRQGLVRAFDRQSGAKRFEHAVGVPLIRVAAPASGKLLAVGTADGRVLLIDPETFARVAEAQPFTDEVRGLAFVDDRTLVAASFDGTFQTLHVTDGAAPLARLPTGVLKGGERVFLAFLGEPGKGAGRGISTVRDTRQLASAVSTDAVKRLALPPVEGETVVMTATGEKRVPTVDLGSVNVGVLTLGALKAGVCDECVPVGAELLLGQDAMLRATFMDDVAKDEVVVKPTEAENKATVIPNALSLTPHKKITLPGPATDLDVSKTGVVVVAFSHEKAVRSFDLYDAEKNGMYPEPSAKSGAALVDLKAGTLGPVMVGHRGFTVTATISPDGKTVATGGWDKRVLVFDAASGKPAAERELAWLVRRVRFAPNGKLLGVAAWTPVNAMNEGNSDPALILYPLALDGVSVAAPRVASGSAAAPAGDGAAH